MIDPASQVEGRDTQGRFVKGTSGNPSGMPKGAKHAKARLRNALFDAINDCDDEQLKAMTQNLLRLASEGGKTAQSAFRELYDRVVGPVVKEVDLKDERKVKETVEVVLTEPQRQTEIPPRN